MSFDGVFTRAMVKELNRDLENGRISKVYQPFQHEIILTIRANRKNKRVLLSAHPSYARIQVINDNLSNPDSAPNFCMVLRKNLEGAYIEDIKQLGNDRIIIFSFRNFDELGDQRQMENWQRLGVFTAGLALDDAGFKDDAEACGTMDMIVAAGGGERDINVDSLIVDEGLKRNDRERLLNELL